MGDISNELEQRKEKFKNFFKEKIGLDNKTLLYLGIYILIFAAFYFQFKNQFRFGKEFIFIILPIVSIILFLLKKPTLAILLNIIGISFIIRLQNLPFLIDVTTNEYIPADPDAMAFLRYAQYIAEHGRIMDVDMLRYYPYGFDNTQEFGFLAYFVVYLHKFLSIFSSNFTLELVDIIYPAIAFAISMIFFFSLVRKLFSSNVALLATAFLAILPSYLFRTLTGISDKEALATVFFYAAFYFYVVAWKSDNIKKAVIFGSLAGIATGLTMVIWGGGGFIFLTIALFTLIELFLLKLNKKDLYYYVPWIFFSFLTLYLLYGEKFTLTNLILSTTTSLALTALFVWVTNIVLFDLNLFKLKDKFPNKIFQIIISFIAAFLIIFLIISSLYGTIFFSAKIIETYNSLVKAFATDRWVRTVAENNQPYLTDWISTFGKIYFWAFLLGSVVLFYDMVKNIKKKLWFILFYIIFLLGITFSRYSPNSNFNGINTLSVTFYIGSILLFILFIIIIHIYSYYKDKELFGEITKIDKIYIFIFIWFFIMIIAGRSAVRLLFILSPITTILAAYLVFKIINEINKYLKVNYYKAITYIAIGLITLSILSSFATSSLSQASNVGPTYNQQWQFAGKWIRENTPEDAVFAHWWDYGYLVQYNNRATISDGGNAGGYEINYFTGRHVLTGQSEQEALEFLKSRNVTHFLVVSDEIGKYPAYSSIGSDVNYDRYSWITTFSLDVQNIQETRNETIYVYRGGFPLDQDLVYNNKVYPRQAAGIGAIFVPLVQDKDQVIGIRQPRAILIYNNEQIEIPLSCLYLNNEKYEFENGIGGCFRVIPVISNNVVNSIGAGFYLSNRVKNSLFAELYLYNKDSENFKVDYTDEDQIPLAIFNGRLIGPTKIWQINYPKNLKVPEHFYIRELPNLEVKKVREDF